MDGSGSVIAQYDYTYQDDGNVAAEQSSVEEVVPDMPDTVMTYAYDNRIATFNGQPVEYDADGNMNSGPLNGERAAYSFDSRNRLVSAGDMSYLYDAENNRIGAIEGVYRTDYVVNPHAPLSRALVKTDEEGNRTYYIYGLGLIAQEENGLYQTYHYDLRGSTVAITDENGIITDRFRYGPYGELVCHDGITSNPFLYNGRDGVITDANGLYYMRARYYNPEIKRFVNRDALPGNVQIPWSLNFYAYCSENPINKIDPKGLWGKDLHGTMTFGIAYDLFRNLAQETNIPDLARIVAEANEKMDEYPYFSPNPLYWYIHFDRDPSVEGDSRIWFAESQFDKAQKAAGQGKWEAAMSHLGAGLHAIQDLYAHLCFSPGQHLILKRLDDPGWVPWRFTKAEEETKDYLVAFINWWNQYEKDRKNKESK